MVYLHVPFCRSFCIYCDFYSEIACRTGRDIEAYTASVLEEIASRREEILSTLGTNTLYIGGGTPSVLPLSCLRRIVGALAEITGGKYSEFTIEVNPEDIREKGCGYVDALLSLGVTRISMGVQSLDDRILSWMRRRHDAEGAREAWRLLKGRADISVDLISGVPGMDVDTLGRTVREVLEWRPEHISVYQLSAEEGSALAGMVEEGKAGEADEKECAAQYAFLCRTLAEAGYHHYEISNWALPPHEAVHNSAYWTRQPYVGLGPGAHSLSISPAVETVSHSGKTVAPREKPQHSGYPDEGGRTIQRRSWNSRNLSGWTSEGETLTDEEIREEETMLLQRTDKGSIPEEKWFVSDDIIASMI